MQEKLEKKKGGDLNTVDKSKVEISQNFVAFLEYTNFTVIKIPSAMNT